MSEAIATPLRVVTVGECTGGNDGRVAWIQDAAGKTVVATDSGRINTDPTVATAIVVRVNSYASLVTTLGRAQKALSQLSRLDSTPAMQAREAATIARDARRMLALARAR